MILFNKAKYENKGRQSPRVTKFRHNRENLFKHFDII